MSKSNSILLLRVTAMLMVFISLAAMSQCLTGNLTLVIAGVPVPLWLFGAAGIVCGIRNWLRVKKIERQVGL